MSENNTEQPIIVMPTPHIHHGDTIESIMLHVIFALIPAGIVGVYIFGLYSLALILITVGSCVFFEFLFQKITKKPITIKDYSAALTGLLLAYNLPPGVPIWLPIVGSFVAIVIAKQLFGGLGQNFINPALLGRAFLVTSYPALMSTFSIDSVTTATPLAVMKGGGYAPAGSDYLSALIGDTAGCIGETCAIALILGAAYLLLKKIISWRIPFAYIATVFILSFICGRDGLFTGYPVYEILTGGLMLGAFYMATDYTTSPVTRAGHIVMGIGCGVLTVLIRVYGGYPEGVSYSILLMNLAVPLIDKATKPRVYGHTKKIAWK